MQLGRDFGLLLKYYLPIFLNFYYTTMLHQNLLLSLRMNYSSTN